MASHSKRWRSGLALGLAASCLGCRGHAEPSEAPAASSAPPPVAPVASPPPVPAVLGPHRWESVVTVSEPTEAALQRALDAIHGPAVVVVPAGRYAITGTIDVKTDDLLLIGASPGSLTLGSPADAGASVLARAADEGDHIVPLLRVRGHERVHVSGLRFAGFGEAGSRGKGVGVLLEDARDFRVDHSYFEHLGFAGVRTNGASFGVIDHSAFFEEFKPAIGTDGYGVAVYGTNALAGVPLGDPADAPRAQAFTGATFIEDDEFSGCRHAAASNKGGRYVFRHNHVTSGVVAHAVDAHGTEYNSEVGGEWIDVYDNRIDQPLHDKAHYDGWAIRIRGGKGLVHGNTITGYRIGVELSQLTDEPTGPVSVWGNTLSSGGPMVKTDAKGATPIFTLAPPSGYRPHAYPHARVAAPCPPGASQRLGWASVCKE